ncbi:MAG: ABC transporter permease [Methanothrix sp.]|nr:ABC transporter permease [Methanothrix sp.]
MHTDPLGWLLRDPAALAGMAILGLVLLMAILGPSLSCHSPEEYTGRIFSPPGPDHPLGTDSMGQDIWSRLLAGARTSLMVAFSVAVLSSGLSLLVGATSALVGGLYERLFMRSVDAMLAIPAMVVMILVGAYLRPSALLLVLLITAFSWPGGARIIRSQVISLKERGHVHAARAFGAGWGYIMVRHIAPELWPIIAAVMVQDARRAVFMEAGLAFLGVSDPALISWGKMMHQALYFTYLDVWRWWLVPTGIALSMTLVGLSMLGIGLEAAMDPRRAEGVQRC